MRNLGKNAIINVIRKVLLILFPFITTKYATNVLMSDTYGCFVMGKNIISYFILLAGLGIETYATREGAKLREQPDELSEFCSQVYTISILSTIFSYLMLAILLLSGIINGYESVVIVLSISIVLSTIGVEWVNLIFEDYLFITVRSVIFQIIAIVFMFLFVKNEKDLITYAFISLIAGYGGYITNLLYVRKYVRIHLTKSINLAKHITPILLLFFNKVMMIVYINSDITLLGILKSDKDVAIYDISSKIYSAYKQVMVAALMVTIPKTSILYKQNDISSIKEIVSNVMRVMLPFLMFTSLIMFLYADVLIGLLSGDDYILGVISLRILSIASIFAMWAGLYFNCIILPSGRDNAVIKITLISALVNLGLNLFFIPLFGFNGAAITTLIAEVLAVAFSLYWTREENFRIPRKSLFQGLILSIITLIVFIISNNLVRSKVLSMVICILISMIIYMAMIGYKKSKSFSL